MQAPITISATSNSIQFTSASGEVRYFPKNSLVVNQAGDKVGFSEVGGRGNVVIEPMKYDQYLDGVLAPDIPAAFGTLDKLTDCIAANFFFELGGTLQSYMESLPGYDADFDNQAIVRMADGTFQCKIVTVE